MQLYPATHQEEVEDIFFGQIVIILARWFFLTALLILGLTVTQNVNDTTMVTLLVVALMGINFFIHGRYVMERPANRVLLMATGVLDLVIITFFVLAWPWHGRIGLDSEFFVFYYPMVFTFALVFPPRLALRYTLLAVGLYLAACAIGLAWTGELYRLADIATFKIILSRIVTLAAMGGLGTFYWRTLRERRRNSGMRID